MAPPYRRADRVADAIRRELCDLLERGKVKDPRVGMVTITDVQVSKDLRNARVLFSNLGSADDHARAAEGLASAAGFLRSEVAHRLELRVFPELRFEFDDSLERSGRLSELFAQIRSER